MGALIAAGAVALLVAGLYALAFEGSLAGHTSLAQLAAMSAAEGGLNVTAKVLADTANQVLVPNLQTVPKSTAQAWGQQSTTYQAAQQNLQAMMTGYGSLQWVAAFPYTLQAAPPAAVVGLTGTLPGPGGSVKWTAYVGIIPVPSPLPSWQDNGVVAVLTFPISVLGHAWAWGPPNGSAGTGQYLGEVTSYGPPNIPGSIVLTYQDCPPWYQVQACSYPTSVSVTIPQGALILNDPNASAPSPP